MTATTASTMGRDRRNKGPQQTQQWADTTAQESRECNSFSKWLSREILTIVHIVIGVLVVHTSPLCGLYVDVFGYGHKKG